MLTRRLISLGFIYQSYLLIELRDTNYESCMTNSTTQSRRTLSQYVHDKFDVHNAGFTSPLKCSKPLPLHYFSETGFILNTRSNRFSKERTFFLLLNFLDQILTPLGSGRAQVCYQLSQSKS